MRVSASADGLPNKARKGRRCANGRSCQRGSSPGSFFFAPPGALLLVSCGLDQFVVMALVEEVQAEDADELPVDLRLLFGLQVDQAAVRAKHLEPFAARLLVVRPRCGHVPSIIPH
jgi:hypothetical protein